MPLAVNVWCENIVIVTAAVDVDVNQTLLHHKTSIKTTNNSWVKKKMVNLKLRENKKDESDADTIEKYSRNFCFHNNGNEI